MIAKRLSGAQSAMMREIAAKAGNFRGVCPLILIFRGRAAAPAVRVSDAWQRPEEINVTSIPGGLCRLRRRQRRERAFALSELI